MAGEGKGEEASTARADPRVGTRVGRYHICFRIALGGMGTVYLARAEGTGRFAKLFAVKLIHPHLNDNPDVVNMFLEEARVTSRINHANVCSVIDFGHHEDSYFMAMEYLAGQTLDDLIREVKLRPELRDSVHWPAIAMRIVMDACEGLHAAHEVRGEKNEPLELVHRDVSPTNIFLTFDGVVKLMDFGVARAVDRTHHTVAGAVKGRDAYMSPEQIRKAPFDRRADVWALGVVFWELLTLEPCFEKGSQAQTIFAVAEADVQPPSSVRPELPEDFDRIVMRALSKDPADRYPTTREMLRDLHKVMARQPEPVSTVDLAELLEELFAEQHRERYELMERARQLDSGVEVTAPEDEGGTIDSAATQQVTGSVSGVRAAPEARDVAGEAEVPPESAAPDTQVTTTDPGLGHVQPPPEPTPGSFKWATIALALLGCVGGVVFGVVQSLEPPDDASVAHESPTSDPDPRVATDPVERGPANERRDPNLTVDPTGDPQEARPGDADPVDPVGDGQAVEATPEDGAASEGTQSETDPLEAGPVAHDDPQTGGAPTSAATGALSRVRRPIRPDRPPLAASVGPPGTVNVVTPGGWADIYVGGQRVGRSPATLTLPAGRHHLELRPFGGEATESAAVTVRSGEAARVVVRLHR